MHIRKMTLDDLEEVTRIEEANFSNPWTKAGFESQIKAGDTVYLVCEVDGKLVGLCGYIRSFEEADVTNVSVLKEYRGHGIGTALMQALIEEGEKSGVRNFTLEVRVGNSSAIHVYERLGFESCGIRPGFYENPKEDAMIMWRMEDKRKV
ncbi:MAG: ribosomal-protein-alanine N-acetyltransferase [Lachnospiraceae bacterium]|nr:ribosomal-protein-alanine N-acetyltransferase [Lachnospiraceae bacterium]SDA46538.1 ribosomal-protein-alanine N-acetyltransferase [Lachnospiraceae bacterium G11]